MHAARADADASAYPTGRKKRFTDPAQGYTDSTKGGLANTLTRSMAEHREEGNTAFREKRYEAARHAYAAALAVIYVHENAERALLLSNMAAVSLKLGQWSAAINDCTAALSVSDAAPETREKVRGGDKALPM